MPNKGRSLSTEENELGEKKKAGKGRQEHHTKTFHLHWMKKHVISRVYREPDNNMKLEGFLRKLLATGDEESLL